MPDWQTFNHDRIHPGKSAEYTDASLYWHPTFGGVEHFDGHPDVEAHLRWVREKVYPKWGREIRPETLDWCKFMEEQWIDVCKTHNKKLDLLVLNEPAGPERAAKAAEIKGDKILDYKHRKLWPDFFKRRAVDNKRF
jgi:hypothetical protein